MEKKILWAAWLLPVFFAASVAAQSGVEAKALEGLSPVTTLAKSEAGRAALGANFTMTGGIQRGEIQQPLLLPFAMQQQQALRDVSVTSGNLVQLADGFGSTLGAAYEVRAHYSDRTHFSVISKKFAELSGYAMATSGSDSEHAKFFFANLTVDGTTPVPAESKAILDKIGGTTDPFGRAYELPAGAPGGDRFGDARPFQTEPAVARIVGPDYFHTPADNIGYNHGPFMNLTNSPSYPSGHTTYAYTASLMLALMVPERYQQMMTRAAEYGNDRILVGAHYAMDVMGGRTLALYDMAHLLANDPAYMNRTVRHATPTSNFRADLEVARSEVRATLEQVCGKSLAVCAQDDIGRFSDAAADAAFYAATLTYNLPVVHEQTAQGREDVGKLAPEAGHLLTAAFPWLSLEQADAILTETEGPGGGFLDDGSAFGVYSRLNLYAAAGRALEVAPKK